MKTLSLVLCIALCGCGVRPNTQVPTAAQAAAISIDDFAALTSAAQDSEQAMYASGAIDKPTHIAIQRGFKQAFTDIIAVSTALRTGVAPETLAVRIQTLGDEINGDLTSGVLDVKDAATQAKLKALVTALSKAAAQLSGGK